MPGGETHSTHTRQGQIEVENGGDADGEHAKCSRVKAVLCGGFKCWSQASGLKF